MEPQIQGQEPVPEPESVSSKPKNTFLIIVVLILLVLGTVALVFFWVKEGIKDSEIIEPTTTENEWKTYTSNEWGFKFSYPQNWTYTTRKGGDSTPFSVLLSDINLDNYSPAPGTRLDKSINVVLYKTNKSVNQYLSEDSGIKNDTIELKDEITISGLPGITVKSKLDNSTHWSAYTSRNGHIYILESVIPNGQNALEVENIFKEVISSFTFIN